MQGNRIQVLMDASSLKKKVENIKRLALDIGFDGFGIAGTDISRAVQRYREWIDLNYHGEMGYMSRWKDKRSDLEKVLPNVQSVICLRTNYFTADKDMGFLDRPEMGDISLYALNEDYHDLIKPKLKLLEEYIRKNFENCRTRVYVDTGPVLEKPLAEKAGLGWVGKHTNLLSEGIGSWYFLSEILLDVKLPESDEAVNRCGTCTECIDICPTGAILAPYILDSRKCISYLTIELKGVIPVEYRKAIGNRIYGCDDCQIVCPWNSFAIKADEASFQEPEGSTRVLVDLIGMDDDTFRRRYRKSPIKRIKRKGFLRNVAVALGNSGNADAVPLLIDALEDHEPLIRAHVVWALGELLKEKSIPVIREKLLFETVEIVLTEIRRVEEKFNGAIRASLAL